MNLIGRQKIYDPFDEAASYLLSSSREPLLFRKSNDKCTSVDTIPLIEGSEKSTTFLSKAGIIGIYWLDFDSDRICPNASKTLAPERVFALVAEVIHKGIPRRSDLCNTSIQ